MDIVVLFDSRILLLNIVTEFKCVQVTAVLIPN